MKTRIFGFSSKTFSFISYILTFEALKVNFFINNFLLHLFACVPVFHRAHNEVRGQPWGRGGQSFPCTVWVPKVPGLETGTFTHDPSHQPRLMFIWDESFMLYVVLISLAADNVFPHWAVSRCLVEITQREVYDFGIFSCLLVFLSFKVLWTIWGKGDFFVSSLSPSMCVCACGQMCTCMQKPEVSWISFFIFWD